MQPKEARLAWEFQAVLQGEIIRREPGKQDESRQSTLWLSGPKSFHGWSASNNHEAKVAVFHYLSISPLLASRVGAAGHVSISLKDSDRNRIHIWMERLTNQNRRPAPMQILLQEAALAELTLLVFEGLTEDNISEIDRYWQRIEAALIFFENNLSENPSIESVAHAGGMSNAHFRRLCHIHLGKSPKAICEEIRLRRILHLLADKTMAVNEIAEQTGYSEPSALSRAFKHHFGLSPRQWRETRSISRRR